MTWGVGAFKIRHDTAYHRALKRRRGLWKVNAKKGIIYGRSGKSIGALDSCGYRAIGFDDGGRARHLKRSLLIFLFYHGYLPAKGVWCVDHIDRNKTNDKIDNLRVITYSFNKINSIARSESGKKCITRHHKGWRVRTMIAGVPSLYGTYPTIEEAVTARNRAVPKYYWDGMDKE